MDQQRPGPGMDVIDSGDHLIGTVESVEHDHFVVQKGFFFPQNHRIPNSAIASIDGSEIVLRISREVALSSSVDQNWGDQPLHGESVPDSSEKTKSATKGGVDIRRSGV